MLVLKATAPTLMGAIKSATDRMNEELNTGNVCVVPHFLEVVGNVETDGIRIENHNGTKTVEVTNITPVWFYDRTPDTGRKVVAIVTTDDGREEAIIARYRGGRWAVCGINVEVVFTNATVKKWREI